MVDVAREADEIEDDDEDDEDDDTLSNSNSAHAVEEVDDSKPSETGDVKPSKKETFDRLAKMRKEKRLAMNRESARVRRKRKKVLLQTLEERVEGLKERNQVLENANDQLNARVAKLEEELKLAHSTIALLRSDVASSSSRNGLSVDQVAQNNFINLLQTQAQPITAQTAQNPLLAFTDGSLLLQRALDIGKQTGAAPTTNPSPLAAFPAANSGLAGLANLVSRRRCCCRRLLFLLPHASCLTNLMMLSRSALKLLASVGHGRRKYVMCSSWPAGYGSSWPTVYRCCKKVACFYRAATATATRRSESQVAATSSTRVPFEEPSWTKQPQVVLVALSLFILVFMSNHPTRSRIKHPAGS